MEWKYDICSLIATMSNVSWSNGICNENCTISYCIMHIDSVKFHFVVLQCWFNSTFVQVLIIKM